MPRPGGLGGIDWRLGGEQCGKARIVVGIDALILLQHIDAIAAVVAVQPPVANFGQVLSAILFGYVLLLSFRLNYGKLLAHHSIQREHTNETIPFVRIPIVLRWPWSHKALLGRVFQERPTLHIQRCAA
jgi:hypothetical protein